MPFGNSGHCTWALKTRCQAKNVGKYLCLLFGLLPGEIASAHGVSEAPSKIPEPIISERSVPQSPRTITNEDMRKLLSSVGVPKDILIVRCTLGKFASCRGLDISLHTSDGKRILTANTGTNGIVGFEGLPEDIHFVARIESSKYQGEVQGGSARVLTINGDRK